jgi:aspartate 1-decarboxylase
MKWVLSSKIQKAVVIEANPDYVGSITIDEDLMDRAGLWPGEKVLVVSNTSGARLETYVITGQRGEGNICMNGAAAKLIKEGEELIIMGFTLCEQPIEPKNILVNRKNQFVRYVHDRERETLEMHMA